MFSTSHTVGTITNNATSVTIPAGTITSAYIPPHQVTPGDVGQYLQRMDFTRIQSNNTDLWQRKGQAGYMTWEQAVAYCLIKPWLTEGER